MMGQATVPDSLRVGFTLDLAGLGLHHLDYTLASEDLLGLVEQNAAAR